MVARKLLTLFGACLGCYLLAAGHPEKANAQGISVGPAAPLFLMNFYGDDDASQCNALATGIQAVAFGQWTYPIRIDTDNRRGGCVQQFAIFDPANVLAGLKLKVKFVPDGTGQCDSPGEREIPIRSTSIEWSDPYRIDTDDRRGGCQQTFTIEGRSDVALDVLFNGDADAGQCGNTGLHTAVLGQSVQLRIDTDSRRGGCIQQFNLRSR